MENKIYMVFMVALFMIIWGIYDIKNKKKDFSFGMQNLLFGSSILLSIIFYYLTSNDVLFLFSISVSFLFTGIYGIWQRKKIKNYQSLRWDYLALYCGTLGIIFTITGWLGFFSK